MKTNRIIMLVLVAVLLVVFGVSLAGNASSYASFAMAKESQRKVHVAGEWVQRDLVVEEENMFQFFVQDSLNFVDDLTLLLYTYSHMQDKIIRLETSAGTGHSIKREKTDLMRSKIQSAHKPQ